MKILIDCRFAGFHAGIGRYTREIVTHLLMLDRSSTYILLVRSSTEQWIPKNAEIIEADIPHYSLAEQLRLPSIIKKSGADIFFCPHFNIPLRCPLPLVVTIHDLILHRYPNQASILKHIAYQILMKHAVLQSSSIIAVSTFTKSELVTTYGKNIEQKITVVHEGVSPLYSPASPHDQARIRDTYQLRQPFFLYVGNAKEHKNISLLLDAFIAASLQDTELVLVTGGPEVANLGILPANVRILSSIPETDLPALYTTARCFVTPSLYEGYCLPAAEALACGCPVIAVNRSALPETVQGNAMLIEPTKEALVSALTHPPTLDTPFVVSRWKEAAQKTAEILHSTL